MPPQRTTTGTLILFLALCCCWHTGSLAGDTPAPERIRLATTTSTENSGLLAYLLPRFTRQTGYEVHVIAVGTGKALRMGRDGDVDVVLVHAPDAEAAFVQSGFGVARHPVMYNDFVVIGPASDPADISNATTAADALNRIARRSAVFISRADNSGTHKKELALWKSAGRQSKGDWYREAGQGMGKVIQIAEELDAYTLTDRGTWIAYRDKSSLELLFQGDPVLHNPYGIIAVNPERYPDINFPGARALIDWITSEPGQSLIDAYSMEGTRLFTPSAAPSVPAAKAALPH